MKIDKNLIHSKYPQWEIRIQSKEKNKKIQTIHKKDPKNRNTKNSRNTHKSRNIHIKHTKYTYIHTIETLIRDAYIHTGTRIYPTIWDAYIHTNSGRVYTPQSGTRIHTHVIDCTLINSSFGTRIGTSIWDAYLGRQFGTRIWDAYIHTGTRIWDAYIHKIHTLYTQNHTITHKIYKYTHKFTQIHTNSHNIHTKNT